MSAARAKRRLIDGRDTPACRAMGRAWWKRHGLQVIAPVWNVRPLR